MIIRVLEDILKDPKARVTSYNRLTKELYKYMPVRDAKFFSWHITLPQKVPINYDAPKTAIFPQYDTLTCRHCDTHISIPLDTPRFNPDTLKSLRSCQFTSSPPQECACGNLKTITQHDQNLHIYLEDNNSKSFSFHSGPINLREPNDATQYAHINTLLNTPRPTTKDLWNLELRKPLMVNHVNLHKAHPHTINMLLPYVDLKAYSRAYNIVLYLTSTIIFPTGHEISYRDLQIEDRGPFLLFNTPKLTIKRAETLNEFTNYLFSTVLPETIAYLHEKQASFLSKRLSIPRTYAPAPPYIPYMTRFGLSYTDEQDPNSTYHITNRPLTTYSELAILRLTYWVHTSNFHQYHKQDYHWFHQENHYQRQNSIPQSITQARLVYLKKERSNLLLYLLPRFLQSPLVSQRHAQHILKHLTIPEHTPIKYPLSIL